MTLYVPPRPFRFEGDIAYIPLTRGLEAIIDASDAHLVQHRNWYALRDGQTDYAVSHAGRFHGKKGLVRLHRVILDAPEDMWVDHEDNDGLNCRRSNIRLATPSQNARNRRRGTNNKSGFKGVSFFKDHQKWTACIRVDGRKKFLGYFPSAEEAHQAYCEAARIHYGEFARVA